MTKIEVDDEFIFHSKNGEDYKIRVININEFRDPWMKYGCDIWDGNGTYVGDVVFMGDDFFNEFKDRFEKIKG